MTDGDCFGQEPFLPVRGSDPFITEIKHISSVSTGCLSAKLGSKLRAAYLWGGLEEIAGTDVQHHRQKHNTFCFVCCVRIWLHVGRS